MKQIHCDSIKISFLGDSGGTFSPLGYWSYFLSIQVDTEMVATSGILYMVQRLVLMGLLVLKELVQSVGLVDPLGLIGEEDGVAVEGHAQLALRHLAHPLRSEHGGSGYAWAEDEREGQSTEMLLSAESFPSSPRR